MAKKIIREFLTIEQALAFALRELSEEEILQQTKRKKEQFTQYANPDKAIETFLN